MIDITSICSSSSSSRWWVSRTIMLIWVMELCRTRSKGRL